MDLNEIWIVEAHWKEMLADVRKEAPLEACGLVAGEHSRSQAVYPIENVLHSPVRFLMAPENQLQVFLEIDDRNWDLLAIYHSHPNGPFHPSMTDLQEAAYPEAVNLIWSRAGDIWTCRGFLIHKLAYREIKIHLSNNTVAPTNEIK